MYRDYGMKRIKLSVTLILVILCFSCARKEGELRFFWQVDPAKKLFNAAEKQYEDGAYDHALALYREYLAKYPDTPLVPAALIKMGLIRVNRQQYEKAHAIFQSVIEAYPDSAYETWLCFISRENFSRQSTILKNCWQ